MDNNLNLDLFSPKKAELQKMADEFKDLKIKWMDDKEWFKKVHEAQMTLRNARTWIQKTRLDYTKQFDEAKKKAMDLEKELIWIITPIEDSLKQQKEKIETEIELKKEQERQKKQQALQIRVNELWKYNYIHHNLFELSEMSEEIYNNLLLVQKTEFEKQEEIRIAKEKEEQEKRDKEAKEREEFEEKQKKLKADQEKLEADKRKVQEEKDKIENDRIEAQRKVDEDKRLEQARKEGEEKAKKDLEEKERLDKLALKEKQDKEAKELEEKNKYQDFLKKHEWKYDYSETKDWKVVLIKIIAEFII